MLETDSSSSTNSRGIGTTTTALKRTYPTASGQKNWRGGCTMRTIYMRKVRRSDGPVEIVIVLTFG